MISTLSGVTAAALYLLCVVHQIAAFRRQQPPARRLLYGLALPAVALHALSLSQTLIHPEGVDLSLLTIAALIALIMIVFVLLANLWQPLDNLFVLIFPLGAVALIGSLMSAGTTHLRESFDAGLVTHMVFSLLAYTILAMAAVQSIAVWVQERGLKSHQPIALLRLLPPLLSMERMLFQLLWTGFVLLTAAITSGFVFLTDLFAQNVAHHTFFSLISWLIFAALLTGHHVFGWRGATATRWTLTGFAFLALAYFGSKFVLEFLLT